MPSEIHSPFHLQLCFLYINLRVVIRFTNGSPSDCLLPQASCNCTRSKWLSHDIHPWSPFRQARSTEWRMHDQHPSFINLKDFKEEGRARKSAKAKKSQTGGSNVNDSNTIVAFGTEEFTLFLASRFLGMWFLTIWMPRNVAIPIFGFIGNLLRFLEMWDDNVWFIPKNLKWIIYFSHSILIFECELPSL